jgi:hypothetical protein
MCVPRPLMIPAPSLARMPARQSLLRIADDGRTPHSMHKSRKVTIGLTDSWIERVEHGAPKMA